MTFKIFSTVICTGVLTAVSMPAIAETEVTGTKVSLAAEGTDLMRSAQKTNKVKKTKKRIWVIGVYR